MIPWKVLSSAYSFEDRWVRLRTDTLETPAGKVLENYHTLEVANSVNIIALTARDEVLLVEQYRPSVGRIQVELPAGLVDEGEEPEQAARRELLEETGYGGGSWINLGDLDSMASRISGRFYTFVALGVEPQQQQRLEEHEEIRILEQPWHQFLSEMPLREGGQVAGLMMLQLHSAKSIDPAIKRLLLAES